VILETARLVLRPLTMEDVEFMIGMWSDPGVHQFIGGAKTPLEVRQKIQDAVEHQQRHGFARWAVTLKTNLELIGLCGPMFRLIDKVNEVELGYAFPRTYWGSGYATEAARAALEHCRTALGHPRVIAIIHPENRASIRVITKIGMHFERSIEWEPERVNLYVAEEN